MRAAVEVTFLVRSGRIPDAEDARVRDAVRCLDGRRAVVTVAEAPKPRRPNKRRYYFGVVVRNVCLALRDAGNSMDEEETHSFLKREVGKLRKVVILPTGEVKYTLRSYMDLTPREESDYLTACVAWCAEMGIDVPPPDPLHNQPTNQQE